MSKTTAWGHGTLGLLSCANLNDKLIYEGKRLQRLLATETSDRRALEHATLDFFSTCWSLYHDWLKFDKPGRPRHSSSKKRHSKEKMAVIMDIVRGVAEGNTHFVTCEAGELGIAGVQTYMTVAPYPYFTLPLLVSILLAYIKWLLDERDYTTRLPSSILVLLDECASTSR